MADLAALVGRASGLAVAGERRLLGIVGAPGSGKSTLAAALVDRLPPVSAVVVPMDGFHLADTVLRDLGRRDRKGAPDTFDVDGFVALLTRLRAGGDDVVYAPRFRRELELAEAGAIPVEPAVPLVVVEGNYLMHWPAVRAALDECWYLEVPDAVRQDRLVARRRGCGEDDATARRWVTGSDQRNAEIVLASRALADLVVAAESFPLSGAADTRPSAR